MSTTITTNGHADPDDGSRKAKTPAKPLTTTVANTLDIPGLRKQTVLVPIVGTAPIITHRFSEKAKRQMLDAMQGRKNPKEPKDPEAEFEAAKYRLDDGRPGFPAVGFKQAIVDASRYFDKSVTMVLLRQTVFVHGIYSTDAKQILVPIDSPADAIMREDVVTVGMSGHDLRYRPEYGEWKAVLPITYVASMLRQESVLSLVDAAGFGIGVGEWRPERSGDFGTFTIDPDRPVETVGL